MKKAVLTRIFGVIFFFLLCLYCVVYTDKVAYALGIVASVLFPIILGLAIAYVINIPMSAIERLFYKLFKKKEFSKGAKKAVRAGCMLLTIVLLCTIITVVAVLIVPELGKSVSSLVDTVAEIPNQLAERREEIYNFSPTIADYIFNFDKDKALDSILNWALSGSAAVMGFAFGALKSAVKVAYYIVTSLMIILFVLTDKERISAQVKKLLFAYLKPEKAQKLLSSMHGVSKVFRSFITGQCLEACILGSLFFISMTILRFPYALMISVLITITALVPIFGAFIGLVVGALLMVIESPVRALWFIILFFVLQQFEGNVIYPKVVGGSVGLPPLLTLLAVFIGGDLFGLLGMIVFIPITSVVYSALRSFANKNQPITE